MADIISQVADKSNDFADFINSIASKSEKMETSKNSDFSNFLNNLAAKAKNVQSSYKETTVNNTVKSNTSSINKKALENTNNSAVKNNEKTAKEPVKNSKKAPEDLSYDTNKNQALNKNSKEVNTDSKKEAKDNLSDKETQNTSIETSQKPIETVIDKKDDKEKNQDTDKKESSSLNVETNSNNNSPVEPSPVVFLDETKKTNDALKKDSELSIGTVLNTKSQETNEKSTDENIDSKDTIEETTKVIQAVEEFLKDDSSLNDNQKEEILKALEEILNKIDTSNTSIDENQNEFSEILTSENKKDETILDQSTIDNVDEVNKNSIQIDTKNPETPSIDKAENTFTFESDEAINDIKEIKKDIDFLTSDIDLLEENSYEISTNKNTTQISNFIAHADSMIEKLKSNPLFPETKIDDLNKVQDILKSIDIKEVETALNSLKLTLKEGLNSLKEIVSDVFNSTNAIELELNSSNINSNVEVSTKAQTIDLNANDTNNFKTQDNKALNDILDILNNDNLELTEKLKEELKAQIKEVLSIARDDKKTDTVIKTVDNAINQENKVSVKENSISNNEIASNLETSSNIKNNSFEAKDSNKESFSNKNQSENESDIDISLDKKADKTTNKTTDKSINETEKNDDSASIETNNKKDYKEPITKLADNLVEDMDLEFNLSDLNLNEGSALSVSDEITKLALSENSSISTAETAGNVVYDSIGANKIIKTADFMSFKMDKITQELDNTDFLSKISNKIENLAQNQGQKLTLVLRPHDLGRLSIEMIKTNNGLSANILAQNDTVRNYIEKHIQGLKDQLAQSGVNVNNIQIKTAGSNNTSNYQGNESQKDNLAQDNKQNSEQGKNNQEQQNDSHNKKEAKEILDKITNLDFKFERNFSAVLNKTLNYGS